MGTCNVHPTAIVSDRVHLGDDSRVLAYCVLDGPLTVGRNALIGPHTVLGSPGGDTRTPRYDAAESPIVIGDDTIIREFAAVQKAAYSDITRIGSRVYVMQGVHVGHDALVEDDVVLAANASLAGLTTLLQGSYVGMGATVHQHAVVGPYAIVATAAAVVKNVRPFARFVPGQRPSVNEYAIEKFGFVEQGDQIRRYVLDGTPVDESRVAALIERFERLHRDSGRPVYQ